MSLAAERTYLAYLRTGLALLAAGVAVAGALPDAGALVLRRVIGVGLIVAGVGMLVTARTRWIAVDRAMRSGVPLPTAHFAHWLGYVLAVAGVAAAVALFLL